MSATSVKHQARAADRVPLRARTDIGLALCALVLVGVTVLTSDWITSGETMGRGGHVLVEFRRELVSKITLEKAEKKLTLERGSFQDPAYALEKPQRDVHAVTHWHVSEPFSSEADESTVDQLLRAVGFARAVRKLPSDQDRQQLGFAIPRWVLELTIAGEITQLRLGKEASTPAGAFYLEVNRVGSEPEIMVVSASTAAEMGSDLDNFRLRGVFPYVGRRARALAVQSSGAARWEVIGNGERWRFRPSSDNPLANARLSRAAMRGFWNQLARTRFVTFLDIERARSLQKATLDQAGLGEEGRAVAGADFALRLELKPKNPQDPTANITVGGACPDGSPGLIVVRHSPQPTAGCVPDSGWRDFSATPTQLVDTGLFFARSDEVASVNIHEAGREVDFAREGTAFVLRKPRRAPLEAALTQERLDRMLRITGNVVSAPASVARQAADGAKSHWVELTLDETQAEATERVALWEDAGRVYAERADGVWLQLSARLPSSVAALRADSLLLRKASVWELTQEKIASVDVRTADWWQRIVQENPREFALEKPVGFQLDAALTRDLTGALTQLRAQRWIAERWTPAYGLSKPSVDIRLELSNDETPRRLLIGDRAVGGGRYATLGVEEAVFVLAEATARRLSQLVLDRSALMLETADIQTLRLERRGRSVVFQRGPAGLLQTTGTPVLSERQRRDLLDALAQLRAEAVVALADGTARSTQDWGLAKVSLRVHAVRRSGDVLEYVVGQGDVYQDVGVFFARVPGTEPVYALPRRSVSRVLDVLNF